MLGCLRRRIRRWLDVDVHDSNIMNLLSVGRSLCERVEKVEQFKTAGLSDVREEIRALAGRVQALEDGSGRDSWASFMAVGDGVVGLEVRGRYDERDAAEARIVSLAGPVAVVDAIVKVRSVFVGATVVVPPDSEIERHRVGGGR